MASGKKKRVPPKRLKKSVRRSGKSRRRAPSGAAFERLVGVMDRLRSPEGCPWDREQTHATLRTYLIEEAYEVLDALDSSDDAKFAEELGDLLLQVLFHAQIAHEEGRFDINDVIREIYEKMIRRHPHVFGEKRAKDAAEVLRNWEIIKKQERAAKGANGSSKEDKQESLLDGVPRSLPALLEGFQLTRKAARVGFDWHNVDGIFAKLDEETHELRDSLRSQTQQEVEDELGDLLFVAANLSRYLKIDPEIALKKANEKFARRFRLMESLARVEGRTFAEVPRPEMESLWDRAKASEKIAAAPREREGRAQ